MADSSDFILNYEFTVNFDAIPCSFSKVSNISSSIDIETIVEGGKNGAPVILRKPKRSPDMLVFERALKTTVSDVAFAVFKEGRKISAININVKRNGKTVRMFYTSNAIIVRREFSALDALDGFVLLQSLQVAHTGITEIPLPFGI